MHTDNITIDVDSNITPDELAVGYASLASHCLGTGKVPLAADMFAAAAASLGKSTEATPVMRALQYGDLALDALQRNERGVAAEMFRAAAAALRGGRT